MRQEQNQRLRSFLTQQLYPFSLTYRRLFDKHNISPSNIRSVEDLRHIPLTSKDDFLNILEKDAERGSLSFVLAPDEALIKKYLPKTQAAAWALRRLAEGKEGFTARLEREYRPIFLTLTAGTTGRPISFLYTQYDLENLKTYGLRSAEIFRFQRGERGVSTFPYAPHLAFWQTVFAGFAANIFILSTGGGKTMGTEGNIASIAKVKPQILIGMPTYVYHILKTAREEKQNFGFLKKIILGAGGVPHGFKMKLAKIISDMGGSGIEVLGTYGFTEARCAWAECPTGNLEASSGYHIYPDKEVFEVIDPETLEVKKEGEDGELVYTNIDARGSCVLRYRTGDWVHGGIVYEPCPYCGRTTPRIGSDIVRASNVKTLHVSKIKGTQVNLNAMERLLNDRADIDEWQIEIVKKDNDPYDVDELVLYVSLLDAACDREAFTRRIKEEVLSEEEVTFNRIHFVTREEIKKRLEIDSAVKAKKIVDRRPAV